MSTKSQNEAVNAPQLLERSIRSMATLQLDAQRYLDAMTSGDPRPLLVLHGYYRTYDGSLVCIVAKEGEMPRPQGLPSFLSAMAQQAEPEPEPEAEDEGPYYRAVVLLGGHGVAEYAGDTPGDHYMVDRNGWVVGFRVPTDQHVLINAGIVGMAGMSLQRKVEMTEERRP